MSRDLDGLLFFGLCSGFISGEPHIPGSYRWIAPNSYCG